MADSLCYGHRSPRKESSASCSHYCSLGMRRKGSRTGCPAFLSKFIVIGKKVSFQCFRYNVKKEQRLWREGEVYTFSPYTLVWNGDYYYVAGYSDQHKAIWGFRVDRIYKQAKILKEDAVPRPASFDEDRYVRTKFRMNSKEPETVELICANETMDAIIDKFGEDVKTYAYNLSSFKAEVEVATSHVFFGWIFGLGGRVVINGPQRVKDEYEKMVRDAAAMKMREDI